jgi:site-specific DNA-adenine methylase
MKYPGGKGGAGVFQTIINLMPAHRVYIEPFIGGGNIYERKKPAMASIVIDADEVPVAHWRKNATPATTVIHGDAISFLRQYDFKGDELVYCDPPYVMSSRSGQKIYKHEMTDDQHRLLLSALLTINANVIISGYRNAIYDDTLTSWHRVDFQAMTRGGIRTESLWLNYAPPDTPAELTFLGKNYRERERIKRKKARWAEKLRKLPLAEQQAIMEVLRNILPSDMTIIENHQK